MGCWSASAAAPVGVSASAAAAAVAALWGCSNATNCAGTGLPAGVLPTAQLDSGQLTIFPAPPDLTPSCSPAVLAGSSAPSYCSAQPSASLPWGAGAWTRAPVPCVGGGARRLQPSLLLSTGAGGGPPEPGGGPNTLDWASIWNPALLDSFNQLEEDTMLQEQWMLYPNGTVMHHYHFRALYSISGRFYQAYPFDKPIYVATRRAYGMLPADVFLSVNGAGATMPQEMDGFTMNDVGTTICPVHKLPGQDSSDCGKPGAEQCSQLLVMWMQLSRVPSGPVQNMIVPITLVIILIGSAFFTNIDAYDARSLIMGTSMIALMSILPFLSSVLPNTTKVTYIHAALYTCFAMMGVSITVIIAGACRLAQRYRLPLSPFLPSPAVSFFLSPDIAAAVKPVRVNFGDDEPALHADDEQPGAAEPRCQVSWMLSANSLRKKAVRHAKLFRAEENIHCKPWLMRLYYNECAIFKRIMNNTATEADLVTRLTYFAEAPVLQRRASISTSAYLPSELGEGGPPSPRKQTPIKYEDAPHLPSNIKLHVFLIELDLAMRFLVVGIYGLVILGAWGTRARMPVESFDCSELLSYFAYSA